MTKTLTLTLPSMPNEFSVKPFPLSIVDLIDNYSMALRRLIALVKHLSSLPGRKQWYVKIVKQYLAVDIIEEVNDSDPNSAGMYYGCLNVIGMIESYPQAFGE